jgi:hypothetical protein
MRNLYYLAALALPLTLTSCDTLNKPTSLKGTYKFIGTSRGFRVLNNFELTDTKFIMPGLFGEAAMDYTVEDDYLYAGPKGSQIRFEIVSPDTLRNEGAMGIAGTYIRVGK